MTNLLLQTSFRQLPIEFYVYQLKGDSSPCPLSLWPGIPIFSDIEINQILLCDLRKPEKCYHPSRGSNSPKQEEVKALRSKIKAERIRKQNEELKVIKKLTSKQKLIGLNCKKVATLWLLTFQCHRYILVIHSLFSNGRADGR